jgi:hypothetical protein
VSTETRSGRDNRKTRPSSIKSQSNPPDPTMPPSGPTASFSTRRSISGSCPASRSTKWNWRRAWG